MSWVPRTAMDKARNEAARKALANELPDDAIPQEARGGGLDKSKANADKRAAKIPTGK